MRECIQGTAGEFRLRSNRIRGCDKIQIWYSYINMNFYDSDKNVSAENSSWSLREIKIIKNNFGRTQQLNFSCQQFLLVTKIFYYEKLVTAC